MVATSYEYGDVMAKAIRAMFSKVMESVVLQLSGFVHTSFQFIRERSAAWDRLWDKLLGEPGCYREKER